MCSRIGAKVRKAKVEIRAGRPNLMDKASDAGISTTWQEAAAMLVKLQEQLKVLLQALGLSAVQPQPVRISQAEQAKLRREASRRR